MKKKLEIKKASEETRKDDDDNVNVPIVVPTRRKSTISKDRFLIKVLNQEISKAIKIEKK
ncbi:MAG: hypothetical protein ACXWL5_03425 [Candidatus Chromulinivorax sp.]